MLLRAVFAFKLGGSFLRGGRAPWEDRVAVCGGTWGMGPITWSVILPSSSVLSTLDLRHSDLTFISWEPSPWLHSATLPSHPPKMGVTNEETLLGVR